MKSNDINIQNPIVIIIKYSGDTSIQKDSFWEISSLDNNYLLRNSETSLMIEPSTKKDESELNLLIVRNLPYLLSIEYVDKKKKEIALEIRIFSNKVSADFSFVVDDNGLDKLKKTNRSLRDIQNAIVWLNLQFIIIKNKNHKIIIVGVHIKSKNENSDFILAGKSGYLHIKKNKNENNEDFYYIERITKRIIKEDYNFSIIEGEISFSDETSATKAKIAAKAVIDGIGNSIEGYLNTWEEYGKKETQLIFDKVKKVGYVKFDGYEFQPDGQLRVDIDNDNKLKKFSDNVTIDDSLEIYSDKPDFLNQEELGVDLYEDFTLSQKDKISFIAKFGKNINLQEKAIFLETDAEQIPNSGYLFLSLRGDIARIKRREESRKQIINQTCPMPHLAALLEGKPVSIARKQKIEPLSPLVKTEIFPKHDPTSRQKQAISIALNTPDLAIIQGPPGTGKTTVITAILKRLNEISSSEDGMRGENLLSAFQHDAVENAVSRVEILGLPAIKFGSKEKRVRGDLELIEKNIDSWRYKIMTDIIDSNPNIIENKELEQIIELMNSYFIAPGVLSETISLMKKIHHLINGKVPHKLINKFNLCINDLELEDKDIDDLQLHNLINTIRRIPIYKESYADNGNYNIRKAVYRLNQEKNLEKFNSEVTKLNEYISRKPSSIDDFKWIRSARKSILIKLIPNKNSFASPKLRENILNLFSEIKEAMRCYNVKSGSEETKILWEYYSSIEDYPLSIRDTILDYTAVFGATCQQSWGKSIKKLKSENSFYNNVLIDEAARSNPLDLFVPMSLAKQRIILVGDHRQLPHIVDNEIIKMIEKNDNSSGKDTKDSVNDIIRNNIKKSLFEHLFNKIKELEDKDGVKRTITLDEQYRTHPILGDFISKQFYEFHKETKISSGLNKSLFVHNLPNLKNKAVVWLEVATKAGKEKAGKSKSRPVEAKAIAKHLKQLIISDEAKGLNFGIITFYSAQKLEIFKALAVEGIARKNANGNYELKPEYAEEKNNNRIIEKLRIGTVDAFQGMEFDVVYLSMVRSNPNVPDKSERDKRRKFGFLMSENRLCVSMSRQKKMLIVVGDSNMLKSDGAKESIRPIVEFYKLCKENVDYGKIIQY